MFFLIPSYFFFIELYLTLHIRYKVIQYPQDDIFVFFTPLWICREKEQLLLIIRGMSFYSILKRIGQFYVLLYVAFVLCTFVCCCFMCTFGCCCSHVYFCMLLFSCVLLDVAFVLCTFVCCSYALYFGTVGFYPFCMLILLFAFFAVNH